jgi:hypothetical protein
VPVMSFLLFLSLHLVMNVLPSWSWIWTRIPNNSWRVGFSWDFKQCFHYGIT